MPNRIAIIDIGTNTVNLLMVNRYNNEYKVIHSEKNGVGLGHGGFNQKTITPSAFKRGLICLNNYSKKCTSLRIKSIYAYGTSTLRCANNAKDFIKSVKQKTNIDITILNGNQEAELIYKGIRLGYDFPEKSVIMDIGGGSTEFILADKNGLIEKESFEIGISRIKQLFNFKDKLSKYDILSIENYLDKQIGDKLNTFKNYQLIGSSGSFKTFYELVYKKPFSNTLYQKIKTKDLKKVLNYLINLSLAEKLKDKHINPLRTELISIAAVKTKWILNKLDCKEIIVSPNSLKEGVIFG